MQYAAQLSFAVATLEIVYEEVTSVTVTTTAATTLMKLTVPPLQGLQEEVIVQL